MKKIILIALVFFLSFFFSSLIAQSDTEDDEKLDRYYEMNTFGQNVFIDNEEGIKSYIFYVGIMDDDQYHFFLHLLKQNAVFAIKETWAKQFIQIESTEEDFRFIYVKLQTAKNEMEDLWKNSSNPLSDMERIMR